MLWNRYRGDFRQDQKQIVNIFVIVLNGLFGASLRHQVIKYLGALTVSALAPKKSEAH